MKSFSNKSLGVTSVSHANGELLQLQYLKVADNIQAVQSLA